MAKTKTNSIPAGLQAAVNAKVQAASDLYAAWGRMYEGPTHLACLHIPNVLSLTNSLQSLWGPNAAPLSLAVNVKIPGPKPRFRVLKGKALAMERKKAIADLMTTLSGALAQLLRAYRETDWNTLRRWTHEAIPHRTVLSAGRFSSMTAVETIETFVRQLLAEILAGGDYFELVHDPSKWIPDNLQEALLDYLLGPPAWTGSERVNAHFDLTILDTVKPVLNHESFQVEKWLSARVDGARSANDLLAQQQIPAEVAVGIYDVSKRTLQRRINAGTLKDLRPPNHAPNAELLLDAKELALRFARR